MRRSGWQRWPFRLVLVVAAAAILVGKLLGQSITVQTPVQGPVGNYNPALPMMSLTGPVTQKAPLGGLTNWFPGTGIGLAVQTTGSGISDLAMGGFLTSFAPHNLLIKLCAAGSPDTFDFRLDATPTCGTPTNITGAIQTTSNGVTVRFGSTSGHNAGDVWTVAIGVQTAHESGWYGANTLSLGTGNGVTTTFTGTLTAPVPKTVIVNAGSITGSDNGSGTIAGIGITAGTINYTSGAVSVTFLAAPGSGVGVNVQYETETCWADDTGQINCVGGTLNPVTFQTNSVNNFSQTLLNLINGTGISIVNTSGGNVQISASGGGQVCTTAQLDLQHDIHASTAGNDSTGNGTLGNPYRTVVRALQDVPFLVCGRWVIHLDTTGTYLGQVNVSGRVFGGGGANYNSGDISWPWSANTVPTTNDTFPYSWLEIVGSTAAPASYILEITSSGAVDGGQAVISMSNANLTLRGLEVVKGGFGVSAENKSYLNLAGVIANDNITSFDAGFGSRIHYDATGTVNNDGVTMASIVNDSTFGGLQQIGWQIHDGSFMDDSDQQNSGNGSGGTSCNNCLIQLTTSAGASGTHALLVDSSSSVHMLGNFNCNVSAAGGGSDGACLFVRASTAILNQGTLTGPGGSSTTGSSAISLVNGNVTSTVGGAGLQLTSWATGIRQAEGSMFDGTSSVTFTTVANKWEGDQGTGSSEGVRSRDVFMGIGLQPLDVSESGTFTPNLSLGTFWRITLTANSTMNAASFGNDGSTFKVLVCENGTGGFTLAFNAAYHGAGTISTAANSCSQQSFTFRSSTSVFYADAPMVTGM